MHGAPYLKWHFHEHESVFREFHDERLRAHEKHRDSSMESREWDHARRMRILVEEVGEVARAFNDWENGSIDVDECMRQARKELIQCGAMVAAWVSAIDGAVSA